MVNTNDVTASVSLMVDEDLVGMNSNELTSHLDSNPEYEVLVAVDLKKFSDYLIMTTHKNVRDILGMLNEGRAHTKHMLKSTLTYVLNWKPSELNKHRKKDSKEYKNFCNDIVIYYCARLILFNLPIPLCGSKIQFMRRRCVICGVNCKTKCSICKKAYYCTVEHQSQDRANHIGSCKEH